MTRRPSLTEEDVAKIQIGVFELIWQPFPWIARIFLNGSSDCLRIYCVVREEPASEDSSAFTMLVKEILTAAFGGNTPSYSLSFGGEVSIPDGFREIMCEEIFRTLAQKIAPWRVPGGR